MERTRQEKQQPQRCANRKILQRIEFIEYRRGEAGWGCSFNSVWALVTKVDHCGRQLVHVQYAGTFGRPVDLEEPRLTKTIIGAYK